jgi:hypothetical protein
LIIPEKSCSILFSFDKKNRRRYEVLKKCPHFYVQVWLIWQFLIQSNSHPSMAFTERLASLDKETFSFEVLFA